MTRKIEAENRMGAANGHQANGRNGGWARDVHVQDYVNNERLGYFDNLTREQMQALSMRTKR